MKISNSIKLTMIRNCIKVVNDCLSIVVGKESSFLKNKKIVLVIEFVFKIKVNLLLPM